MLFDFFIKWSKEEIVRFLKLGLFSVQNHACKYFIAEVFSKEKMVFLVFYVFSSDIR
jgi:hypothetical protein